jgi:hypothetical protein
MFDPADLALRQPLFCPSGHPQPASEVICSAWTAGLGVRTVANLVNVQEPRDGLVNRCRGGIYRLAFAPRISDCGGASVNQFEVQVHREVIEEPGEEQIERAGV